MSILSSPDQVTTTVSDAADLKSWSRFGERSTAIMFATAAVVAMLGWLYLLAQGLWAVASWLVV
jgi:hypothetical protein